MSASNSAIATVEAAHTPDDGKAALYGGALNYEQFRKLFPASRCFQKYDHNGRANLAASHRAGHVQRHSVGEYYYVHELIPDRCYPTARRACEVAFEIYLSQFSEPASDSTETNDEH